ncbi:hypothetical protein ACJ6WF_40010 [Streptomyces sp. MMS24-I2-30]|uniref:hypothetical protein n=1 Tax=Streptomyces sp. MMS24-I2-30 TaxID=3351564 RepID=UPI0038968A4A
MSSTSATCFSNSRSDHQACPFGGVEQASAISLASTSPVTGEGTGGNARSFRPTVAHTSPPVSTYRFEIRRTDSHETPTRSAITARGSTSPTDVSNASSTRARLIIDALRTPVVVTRTNARRSSTLNATGYFFCEDTAPPARPNASDKGSLPHPQLHQPEQHLTATTY